VNGSSRHLSSNTGTGIPPPPHGDSPPIHPRSSPVVTSAKRIQNTRALPTPPSSSSVDDCPPVCPTPSPELASRKHVQEKNDAHSILPSGDITHPSLATTPRIKKKDLPPKMPRSPGALRGSDVPASAIKTSDSTPTVPRRYKSFSPDSLMDPVPFYPVLANDDFDNREGQFSSPPGSPITIALGEALSILETARVRWTTYTTKYYL